MVGRCSSPRALVAVRLLHHLVLAELGECQDIVDDAALEDLLEEVFVNLALAAKLARLEREVLFSLRVEGGVLDEAVDKDPKMVFDLEWLDGRRFVLLLDLLYDATDDLCL